MTKIYYTHDNYNRPFKVFIDGEDVTIYKKIEEHYLKVVKTYKIEKIYVGKSKSGVNGGADHTKAQEKMFVGNSILLQLKNKYVFIGHEIYEFTMPYDEIEKYYSVIGRNDVPYPIIVGKKNVYFMLDEQFVSRDAFPSKMNNLQWQNVYSLFYGEWDKKEGWINTMKDIAKKMKKLKIIQKRL